MADVNQVITLGVGTPSDIEHFILVGLSGTTVAPPEVVPPGVDGPAVRRRYRPLPPARRPEVVDPTEKVKDRMRYLRNLQRQKRNAQRLQSKQEREFRYVKDIEAEQRRQDERRRRQAILELAKITPAPLKTREMIEAQRKTALEKAQATLAEKRERAAEIRKQQLKALKKANRARKKKAEEE